MANDIPQYEPEPGDEGQLDEFGIPIPTQEDMEAEYLRTHQTIALADQMRREEAQLPTDIGPAPMLTQVTPSAPPLTLPVSRGRMYMGPALSSAQEREFLQSAPGTSINLVAPPTAPAPTRLERLQAMDRPGTRTVSLMEESPYSDVSMAAQQAMMRYEAIRRFNAGDRSPETVAAALGTKVTTPRARQTAVVPGVGLVDRETGSVITPVPQTETVTETIPATEGVPATPGQAARSGFLGIGARPAVPATAAIPAAGEKKITRKVTVTSPTATSTPGRITTKAQFDALPSGTVYIGKDGKRYRKP